MFRRNWMFLRGGPAVLSVILAPPKDVAQLLRAMRRLLEQTLLGWRRSMDVTVTAVLQVC
jgi:hypothetical protein